jgi:hypothetical protein
MTENKEKIPGIVEFDRVAMLLTWCCSNKES